MTIFRFRIYVCIASVFQGWMMQTRSVKWKVKREESGKFWLHSWTHERHAGRGPLVSIGIFGWNILRSY